MSLPVDALAASLRAVAEAQSIPGFVAAIVAGDDIVFRLTHGVTDLEAPSAVTLDTRFPLASVTKVATAAAIHAEAAQGTLQLGDRLSRLLPDVAWADPRAARITLARLLSHTAGLDDFDPIAWADDAATDEGALGRAVRAFAAASLLHEPGRAYRYSNAGYDAAGLALARVAGVSFEEAVRGRVLSPLGMVQSSFFPHPASPDAPAAVGHVGDGRGGVVPYRGSIGSRSHAACGTLASTARDVAKLAAALAASTRAALPGFGDLGTRVARTGRPDGAWSGLGVRLRERRGEVVLEHGGWDPGFRCAVAAIVARGLGALVLTNFNWSSPVMMECLLDAAQGVAPSLTDADLAPLRTPPPAGRGATG